MPTNPKQMSMISSRNLFGLLKFKTIPFIHSFLWQHEPYLILYLDMNDKAIRTLNNTYIFRNTHIPT